MKTSIIKLSTNEYLYVNGGVNAESFINNIDAHSINKELVSQIGAVGAGGAILTIVTIATKFAYSLIKEKYAIDIIAKTISSAISYS